MEKLKKKTVFSKPSKHYLQHISEISSHAEWTISLFKDEIGERMISESRNPTGMRFRELNSLRIKLSNGDATTTITTVFNSYNESNGVAFKWI